jgi:hypothetical protein
MLSLATITTRVNNELTFLGGNLAANTAWRDNVIKSAVKRFVQKMDKPLISATLAVASGTLKYSKPATINKIYTIRDSSDELKPFYIQKDGNKIVFSTVETGDYTIYGTPADVGANVSTVLDAIPDDYEPIVWSYIIAFWYETKNQKEFVLKMQFADQMAYSAKGSENRDLSSEGNYKVNVDAQGNVTDNDPNPMGMTPSFTNFFGGEL